MPDEWRYSVAVARLPGDLTSIHEVRRQVFIIEQGIPAHLEWDGQDSSCHHVLATDPRQAAIGTGRLDPRGRIGRMAVLPDWRSHGVGRELLDLVTLDPDEVRAYYERHYALGNCTFVVSGGIGADRAAATIRESAGMLAACSRVCLAQVRWTSRAGMMIQTIAQRGTSGSRLT